MFTDKDKLIPLSEDGPFNYVLGLMRGAEHTRFIKMMAKDPSIQREVHFWEESLMPLHEHTASIEAYPQTWQNLQRMVSTNNTPGRFKSDIKVLHWLLSATIAASILVGAFLIRPQLIQINADYVAVLTNESGKAQLTVLTSDQGKSIWLEWHLNSSSDPADAAQERESSFQLWAVSRRDGEFRSLAVLPDSQHNHFEMREYHWRLIRDADYLLLTKEEKGGSPFNEPSDRVLARGECVRLNKGA